MIAHCRHDGCRNEIVLDETWTPPFCWEHPEDAAMWRVRADTRAQELAQYVKRLREGHGQ